MKNGHCTKRYMKNEILRLFEFLEQEFRYQEAAGDSEFPIKHSFLEDSGKYINVLLGRLSTGLTGSKTIMVDEYSGVTQATTVYNSPGALGLNVLDSARLTAFRCGLVAAYVVWKTGKLGSLIALIGGGRINLYTAYMLSLLGASEFVYIGGRKQPDKNIGVFRTVTDRSFKDGVENVRHAEVIITSTSNNSKDGLYSADKLGEPHLTISQDGGFTLGAQYRKYKLFSDYPAQLKAHAKDEFMFDNRPTRYKFRPLYELGVGNEHVGVYLYGTIIADLVVADFYEKYPGWFKGLPEQIRF